MSRGRVSTVVGIFAKRSGWRRDGHIFLSFFCIFFRPVRDVSRWAERLGRSSAGRLRKGAGRSVSILAANTVRGGLCVCSAEWSGVDRLCGCGELWVVERLLGAAGQALLG